jgi:hypothetical protein
LSVYDQGLLVTVSANLGIDERHHVETTIHPHDATGIIHIDPDPTGTRSGTCSRSGACASAPVPSVACRTAARTASGCM